VSNGYLLFLLHCHLPFVRHPEHPRFLEEDWLFEGISETYLPLLRVIDRLREARTAVRLTVSVSPTLLTMLSDELLQDRYTRHLERLLELAGKEVERTRSQPHFNRLAWMYLDLFSRNYEDYTSKSRRNIVPELVRFRELGLLELITSAATHSYLPLLEKYPTAVDAQIRLAVELHEKVLGSRPRGIWLPECGYFPGLEEFLEKHGLEYFFVDTHGILFADRRPSYGNFAPIVCENGTAAFGRDPEASRAVWSAEEGYPGDISYREFYRDIGYDLPLEYIRPYIHEGDVRINTGIKYYAITGPGDRKRPYDREEALGKVEEHSENFIYRRRKQFERISELMDRPPLIVAPFDAELFGHWWFEGPEWLESLFTKLDQSAPELKLVTPLEYLSLYRDNQTATPSYSSWGNKGYSEVWLSGSNDWIYRHVHKAVERMSRLAKLFVSTNGVRRRALNQAARELMLMQASDWPFIMKTGTTVPYAVKRIREHIFNFNKIYDTLLTNQLDLAWLTRVEARNNIFPDIDYRIFS